MTNQQRVEWASKLAEAIKRTWQLGPKEGVWYDWLRINVNQPDTALRTVARLRREHDSTTLTIARFQTEYVRDLAGHQGDTDPHANCPDCDGTGYITFTDTSPISGQQTGYATPCTNPRTALPV